MRGRAQVECPAVTPLPVLRASGHVERFTDLMVRDLRTNECHRADHLLEHALEAALADGAALKLSDTRVEVGGLRDSHHCSHSGSCMCAVLCCAPTRACSTSAKRSFGGGGGGGGWLDLYPDAKDGVTVCRGGGLRQSAGQLVPPGHPYGPGR